jgi:hypothetical protein
MEERNKVDYTTGIFIKAQTIGNGFRKGEIIKILENTLIIYSNGQTYLVKKDEKNLKIINGK